MLDVSKILKSDEQIQQLELELNIKEFEYNYDKIVLIKPIVFKGKIINFNKMLNVVGEIILSFKISCYSCLEEYEYSQVMDFDENFMQKPDEEEYQILSESIDLEKAVIDNILLKLPTKFQCKDDCKGLCQTCGINLNYNKCNCNDLKIDSRFEKLKQLKINKNM